MFEEYANIPCRLVHNENGVFLVFDSTDEAYQAADLFTSWVSISSFGQYENALTFPEKEA